MEMWKILAVCMVGLVSSAVGEVAPDGTCGPASAANYTCDTGFCCSQYGYCGTTVEYCGDGCHPDYGTCGGGTEAPAPPGTPAQPGLQIRSCTKPGLYALTFDDGPSEFTESVLETLAEKNALGTFFVLGSNLEDTESNKIHRRSFQAAYRLGHLVASHSYDHPHFTTLTVEEMSSQLNRTADIFKELIGVRPRYFRAPYGEVNQELLDLLKVSGLNIINWNLDPRDWESRNETRILGEIEGALSTGDPKTDSWIDVKHDTVRETAAVLGQIIDLIRNKGYEIVCLTLCVGDEEIPYTE